MAAAGPPACTTERRYKNGARQYRELARRFVMWRQRDMLGLVKKWKMAAVTSEKRLSKAGAKKVNGDQPRVARAIRLLRRGAISRAVAALESKGLGDMDNPEMWEQLQKKYPDGKQEIGEDAYEIRPDEEVELKVGNILPKLDMNPAPGPSGLRTGHIKIWAGVFSPPSADEAIEWLEKLLTDMANDRLPGWFIQAIQAAELMAMIKAEATKVGGVADHRPVQIPNTLAKVGDKAVSEQCQAEYAKEMMPQQVGVGVQFAAELMAMGLRMVLHL